MNIAITSDSALDLPKNLLEKYRISVSPFALIFGGKEHADGEVCGQDLFDYTAKTGELAKTAAVNEAQYLAMFEKVLKDNDHVINFTISSTMSASYMNAVNAAKAFPGKVDVIDSRVLSTGIALEAIYARKLADAGYSPEEIVSKVNERIPFNQSSFALESVNFLYKGGRCSAMAKIGANLLHLKPQIIVKNGSMIAGKKFRGPMNKWVMDYVEETLLEFPNPDHEEVFITYSSAPDEVVEMVKERLRKAGFKNIMNTSANGTVCCHCGPNCLGILYFNDGDHPVLPKE